MICRLRQLPAAIFSQEPTISMLDWLRRFFAVPAAVRAADAHDAPAVPDIAGPVLSPSAASDPSVLGITWLQHNEVNVDFNHWVFNTAPGGDLFITPLEQKVLDALGAIVDSHQSGANLVRRMPGVIPQLLQSLRTDDFSGAELSRKISNDVVLVAEVVRLANSVFYMTQQSITSIEHAVLVLGQSGLRQLISGVAFKPIIGADSGYFTRLMAPRLWQQAEQCALANRFLAEAEHRDSFEAFLAGLVQNVGLLAALRVMEQVAGNDGVLGSESFCNALLDYARTLSCSIASEWQFSSQIIAAIAQQRGKVAEMSALARILSNGDYLSKLQLLEMHGRVRDDVGSGLTPTALACLESLRQAALDAAAADVVQGGEPLRR